MELATLLSTSEILRVILASRSSLCIDEEFSFRLSLSSIAVQYNTMLGSVRDSEKPGFFCQIRLSTSTNN